MNLQYTQKVDGILKLMYKFVFISQIEGSTTAVRIQEHLTCILAEKGFPEPEQLLKKTTFVTDGGADLVAWASMSDLERLYCFAHYLNVVLSNSFEIKIYQLDIFPPEASVVIEKVVTVVQFLTSQEIGQNLGLELPKGVKRGPLPNLMPLIKKFYLRFNQVTAI